MEKIEFYKNNRFVDLKDCKINFNQEEMIVTKENDDTIIILDFTNKTCTLHLKSMNQSLEISVLKMSYNQVSDRHLFEYTLTTEAEVENLLIIHKK